MLLGQINGPAGQDVLSAAQPIFQRNLQLGADTLRQSGPRFNSNTERLIGDQGNKALQDFNLFSQNVIESGRNRQLNAAQTYGGLAQGADNSYNQLLQGAGGFANQMQGQQLNSNTALIQALLGLSGQAGIGPAALVNHPGGFANVMKAIGTGVGVGSLAAGMFGGGSKDPLAGEGALTGNPGNYAPGTGPGGTVSDGNGGAYNGGVYTPVAPLQPGGQSTLRNRFPWGTF